MSPEDNKKTNRVDHAVSYVMEAKEYAYVDKILARFNPDELEGEEKEYWYYCWGTAPYELGDRELAFSRFQEGMKRCPECGPIAFALGREYENLGEPDQMIELFDRAVSLRNIYDFRIKMGACAYLWNRFEKAASYIEWLFEAYRAIRVMDPSFLAMRGAWPYDIVWASYTAFHKLSGNLEPAKHITVECNRAFGNKRNFNYQRSHLYALETGNFGPYMKELTMRKDNPESLYEEPCLNFALKAGIIKSRSCGSQREAEKILEVIEFEERCRSSLETIRLLALCSVAHQWGDREKESRLVDEFMKKCPRLLSPWDALDFNLLDYQETLKSRYQASKTAGRK